MPSVYKITFSTSFQNKYKKFTKKLGIKTLCSIEEALSLLSLNPFSPQLSTHQVMTTRFGIAQSSRITGDIRIIWSFDSKTPYNILLHDIGGHSGKNSVYK